MRWLTALAALNGLLAVAIGAFGAHAVTDVQAKAWIATGATYALAHAVAALWAMERHRWAAISWSIGALLFAGSLYAIGLGAPRTLATLAPVGGTAMLAGWALLLAATIRQSGSEPRE